MFKNNAIKVTLIILITTLCLTAFILTLKDNNQINEEVEKTYTVKIYENFVYLFENDKIIKQYDIDISVLPGDDIELLIKGIKVDSVSDADLIAEDYDG